MLNIEGWIQSTIATNKPIGKKYPSDKLTIFFTWSNRTA
jgi:hypothetical protein